MINHYWVRGRWVCQRFSCLHVEDDATLWQVVCLENSGQGRAGVLTCIVLAYLADDATHQQKVFIYKHPCQYGCWHINSGLVLVGLEMVPDKCWASAEADGHRIADPALYLNWCFK